VKTISVAVVFNWRNEISQSGLYSVHIRIRLRPDARYLKVPLAEKVRKDQWLGRDHQWIKDTHPYAFQINNAIIDMKGKIASYVKECLNFNKPVTLLGIVEHMTNKDDSKSFLDFMERYILRPPEKLEINRLKNIERRFPTCDSSGRS
jgi:hypothetical protein